MANEVRSNNLCVCVHACVHFSVYISNHIYVVLLNLIDSYTFLNQFNVTRIITPFDHVGQTRSDACKSFLLQRVKVELKDI